MIYDLLLQVNREITTNCNRITTTFTSHAAHAVLK